MNTSSENTRNWKETLLGEALLLGVLSKIMQSQPEKEWIENLIKEDLFSELPLEVKNKDLEIGLALLHSWSNQYKDGFGDHILVGLRADHTNLFVGVGKPVAPPWESVYFNEDRMIFQEQTLQVREWYRKFGLEPENLRKEPDDHIALELSFLAHLASLGLMAIENKDDAGLEKSLQAQRQFLHDHTLRWMKFWAGSVEKHAKTDLYRGTAILTRGTLMALVEVLGVEMPEEIAQ
ncbi:MAG: TorD/DmsD family molecular chaperone [Chloroflexota bacterium]